MDKKPITDIIVHDPEFLTPRDRDFRPKGGHRIFHPLNYQTQPGEVNTRPSLTVPDQSLSIRAILENHTRGIALPEPQQAFYDENFTYPDPRTLDLTDRDAMRRDLHEKTNALKERVETETKQSRAKHRQAAIEAELKQLQDAKADSEKLTPPKEGE